MKNMANRKGLCNMVIHTGQVLYGEVTFTFFEFWWPGRFGTGLNGEFHVSYVDINSLYGHIYYRPGPPSC